VVSKKDAVIHLSNLCFSNGFLPSFWKAGVLEIHLESEMEMESKLGGLLSYKYCKDKAFS